MKISLRALSLLTITMSLAGTLCSSAFAQAPTEIGGKPTITLTRKVTDPKRPEFTSITLLPGRALMVQQITAQMPGKGSVDVLYAPDLAGSKKILDQDDDQYGNQAYRLGACFLYPYPNRMRGKLSADSKIIETSWNGKKIELPANWKGGNPGAELNAMHGLILKRALDSVEVKDVPGGQQAIGTIHGGDFGGHWLGKSELTITVTLRAEAVDVEMTTKNVGTEAMPVAFTWHPYFNIPSGDRTQARLVLPAGNVAEVDNYDNVFPTGKLINVAGTKFDFNGPTGKALADIFMDDNFSDLKKDKGIFTAKVIDPKANYQVTIESITPNVRNIQLYAPPTKSFIVIEHQTNINDPFGKQWGKAENGIITVEPGKTANWHVRVKVSEAPAITKKAK